MVEALYNEIRKKVTALSGTAKEKYIWWIAARWSSHRFHAFSFPLHLDEFAIFCPLTGEYIKSF
jgi:hypothetical protein